MRLLLDTNTFLWSTIQPERLGRAADLVEDRSNDVLISAVTAWEIAIKSGLGKLPLPEPPDTYVPAMIKRLGGRSVAVETSHALKVADLPQLHRDPFDRLLIAQAIGLDATLLTTDRRLAAYPAETILV